MTASIEMVKASIRAPGGRCLFDGLDFRLTGERVALVGRNGVGKSLLLATLAGIHEAERGSVRVSGRRYFVPQELGPDATFVPAVASSHGERRRRTLARALESDADILLLDEPTEDLDEAAVTWLRRALRSWSGGVLVASHDRRLLSDFEHFFVASESGCRYFAGTLCALEDLLSHTHRDAEERYAGQLANMVAKEQHTARVTRRRARKKRYGRVSELDRATPRIRLNQKRSDAQVYQGRFEKIRRQRLEAVREWTLAARRALAVNLALELPRITLPAVTGEVLSLTDVAVRTNGRTLFDSVNLRFGRRRVAIVGPNGAGKTTLLDVMLGKRRPTSGAVRRDPSKIGSIGQGGADWFHEETLIERLHLEAPGRTIEEVASAIVAHRFPLALAERPMSSLSAGERARAALLCLFHRRPAVELLVLDEPTYALDLIGQRALVEILRAWPGGLVVTSHDAAFLRAVGFDETVVLGSPAQ